MVVYTGSAVLKKTFDNKGLRVDAVCRFEVHIQTAVLEHIGYA